MIIFLGEKYYLLKSGWNIFYISFSLVFVKLFDTVDIKKKKILPSVGFEPVPSMLSTS